jgi:hypothetical protein
VFRMCSIDADSAAQGRVRAAVNDIDFWKADGMWTAPGAVGREFESLRAHHALP